MTNPKPKSGPVAGSLYPIKPGDPIRKAINDEERKEATILTHSAWMDDPPGSKNCHFLDIIEDDVGPNGITIDPSKTFDEEAQWKYLEGVLQEKVDQETATKIHSETPPRAL